MNSYQTNQLSVLYFDVLTYPQVTSLIFFYVFVQNIMTNKYSTRQKLPEIMPFCRPISDHYV